jgi:hypothetical protein
MQDTLVDRTLFQQLLISSAWVMMPLSINKLVSGFCLGKSVSLID